MSKGVKMGKQSKRKFTPEYKAEVVQLVKGGIKSVAELARDLGLTESGVVAGASHD